MRNLKKAAKQFARGRKANGQAIVEGTVALVLIIGVVVGGILLTIGSGLSVFYKTKLAYAAEVGARYGAQSKTWLGAPRPGYSDAQLKIDVSNAVNAALIGLGLPKAKSDKITVITTTIEGVEGLLVSVEEGGLEIISGGILPPTVTLTETAFYAFSNDHPIGVMGMSIGGTSANPEGKGIFVPVYGAGANTNGVASPPVGNLPYWKVAIIGETVNGLPVSRFDKEGEQTQLRPDKIK